MCSALLGLGCGAARTDSAEATGGAHQETGGRAGSTGAAASSAGGNAETSVAGGGSFTGGAASANELGLVEVPSRPGCTGTRMGLTHAPPLLEFVVDTGGPVEGATASAATNRRWAETSDALRLAFANLPPRTAAGVSYYPGLAQTDTASGLPCIGSEADVPIGALPYDLATRTHELTESLAKIAPGGERPTLDAYSDALDRELSANAASGARVLILVSGGPPTLGPNCTTPESNQTEALAQPLLARIEEARQSGIRTLVVGDPEAVPNEDGSAFRRLLSTAAALGGTALEGCDTEGPNFCHVDLSAVGGETLNEAITRVVPNLDVCALSLPIELRGAAFAFKLVFSPAKGEEEFYVVESSAANANCQLGYWLDGSTIRLCQNTCAKVRSDPFASLSVEVPCSTL